MPETIKNNQVNPNPVSTLSEWDLKTRDFLIEKMRKAGLKVNTNWEEGQKVLNEHWYVRRQRAWHGSPYDFKRFDHSRIGTGEGNLSFGRGTYVSQDKAVGKHYADMLGQTPEYEVLHHGNPVNLNAKYDIADETHIARILYQFDGDFDKAYQWQKDSIEQFHAAGDYSMEEVARQIVDAMGQEIPSEWTMKEIPNRHLYEVEIPDEGFLKWNEAVDDGIAGEILRDLQWEVAEQQGLSDAEKREMVLKLKKEYEEAYITDGEDLYDLIKGQPGFDDQKASEFLAGYFKGIEYDTNFFDGGNKEGKKNFVIFQEEDITIKNHYKFFLDGNNEAYGFVDDDNNIYIDTRIATAETPIHEYAHLWAEAIRQQNPKEWNHIKEMIQENPSLYQYSQEIKERYHHLKSEDDIMDEVLATMTGKQAHTMLKGLGDEPIEKINNAFWKETAHFLDIHFTYSSQIAGKILQDLVSCVNPVLEARKREQQKMEAQTETAAFKEWFRNSKVVTPEGKPMVLYHGTKNGEFYEFSHSYKGKTNKEASLGFWFTPSLPMAQYWADTIWASANLQNRERAVVMPVYLSMQKPKVYEPLPFKIEPVMERINEQLHEIQKEESSLARKYSYVDYLAKETFDIVSRHGEMAYGNHGYPGKELTKEEKEEINDYYRNRTPRSKEAYTDGEKVYAMKEEKKKLMNQYYTLRYSDPYEQFRTDMYSMIGRNAEDANIGGTGMALFDGKEEEMLRSYKEKLLAEGYDGIIIKDTKYDSRVAKSTINTQYLVFNPEQIKSATMNIGTFQKEKADIRFHQTEKNQHTKQHRTMNEAEQRLVDVFNELTEDTSRRKNFEEIMKEILPNNGDKMVLGLGGGMEINFTYNHQAYTIIPDEIKNINGELHIGNEEMYVPLNKIPEPEKDFVDEIVKNMAYETLIAERIGEGNEIRFKEPLTIATDAENNEVALIDAIHVSGHQLSMEGRQEYEGEWLDLRNHSLMKDGFENLYHQITNMTISEKTEMEKLSDRLVELTNPDISLSFQQGREGTLLEQRQYEKLLQIENPKNLRQWAEETMTITNGGRGHQLDNIQRETNREYIEVAKEVANLNDVQLENLFIITYGPLEPEKITQKTDENLSLPLRSLIEKMNERMNDLRNEFVPDELKGKVETTVNIIPDESFPLPYQKISSFESYDKGLGIMLVNPQDIQQPATTVGELSEKDTRSLAQYLTSHHEEIKEMVKDQMEQHVEVARSQNERLPELFSQVYESAEKLLASKETSGQAQEGWEILSNLKNIREGVISEPEKIRETIRQDRSLLISDTALKLDEMTNGKYAMLSHLMAYTATDHTLSQIASLSRQKDYEQDIQENIKEQYQILTKERTNGCVIAVTLPETQKQEDVQAVEVNPNRDTRVHTGNGTVLCLWELSAEDQKRIADWAITGYREDQLQKAMMDNNQSSIVFQKPIAHIAEVTVETEKTKGMTYYTRNGTIYFPTDLNRQENDQILTKGLEIAKASKLRQDKDLVDDTVLQFEKNYSFQVQMPVKERNGQLKEYGMTITAIHVDAEKNRINVSVQQPGAKGIIQLGDLNRMNQLAVTYMALAMRREQLFIEQQLEKHSVTYKSKNGETVLRSEANGLRYNIPLTETEKKQLHEGKVTTADLAKEHFTKKAMEANRGVQQGRSM